VEKMNGSNLVAPVQGKISDIQKISTKQGPLYKHIIIAPAKEEYGFPNTVAVIHSDTLGSVGEVVTALVAVRGRVNRKGDARYYNHELWVSKEV